MSTYWSPDDIGRVQAAEAATEVGADDDRRGADRSVEMMCLLLLYATVVVAVIGAVVIALTR